MLNQEIVIQGAREHNLKNVNLTIPRDKLVVFTGLSGSGKSSLAFDTIYAEGQRRYVESLSSYARMFLGQMEKPDVDYIGGLSPAISIDQKTTSRNPRSTVGTVTEIHDYLRLLYARAGTPHCPECGKEIKQQTVDQMVDKIKSFPEGTRMQILAPVVRARKGEHQKYIDDARKNGFVRVRIDGEMYELDDPESLPKLDKQKKHTLEIVIDRLALRQGIDTRLYDSLETALKQSGGICVVDCFEAGELLFSQNYACPDCGISIDELAPRLFSFNSPFGACPTCTGLGSLMKISEDLIVPDSMKSLNDGAIDVMAFRSAEKGSSARMFLAAITENYGGDMDTPFRDLPEKTRKAILYGSGKDKLTIWYEGAEGKRSFTSAFEGVIPTLERRYAETSSEGMRQGYEEYMTTVECPDCHGKRLKREALAVTVGGKNLAEVSDMSIADAREFFKSLKLGTTQAMIAEQILKEINARLGFLVNVGLDYLTLSRAAVTLSGGEAQRIRLATQIGSGLTGVLYILDEPSIGLHQRDNGRLLETLKGLRDLGNTLIVVEHDEDTMRAADYIVDVGPGAGVHGGYIVSQGTPEEVMKDENSLTGQYLSGKRVIPVPKKRRAPKGFLTVKNAKENNLRGIDVKLPLGVFCCVTGVSGSGKSSLVNEIVYKTLARDLNRAKTSPGKSDGIDGIEQLDKVINIDQSPIGRTPRSNPATYTGLFNIIRTMFAQLPDAKARGYKENRFSFNVKGGRCEACQGDGVNKIEMHFLPDIYVPCEVCHGKRYNRETLEVKYKGMSIADVLDMTVENAYEFFENLPQIQQKLKTLYEVGLGYMKLGQPSTELSGGEAQRIKLATELSRRSTGKTMYILDEPTTGLHSYDVEKLISSLQQLVKGGNSILVIEHNLDIVKTADFIVDLGPEGGTRGGTIVCEGTPEQVAAVPESYTGQYLKKLLARQHTR